MTIYNYTRYLNVDTGQYNIVLDGEAPTLGKEIVIQFPQKQIYIKCFGIQVEVHITPALTVQEKTDLDNLVQTHKDNNTPA